MGANILFATTLVVVSLVGHPCSARGEVGEPAVAPAHAALDAGEHLADYALESGVLRIRVENEVPASRTYESLRFGAHQSDGIYDFASRFVGAFFGLDGEAELLAGSFSPSEGIRVCGCLGFTPSSIVIEPPCTIDAVRLLSFPGSCAPAQPRHVPAPVNTKHGDPRRFLFVLKSRALPLHGASLCARHVRQALEAAGFDSTGHPARAKDWGPTLFRMGFRPINPLEYQAARGDVVVFQSESGHPNGHIQAFDGKAWISDFIQSRGFWPSPRYRADPGGFTPYRYTRDD